MKPPAISVYTFPAAAQISGTSGQLGCASLDWLAIDLTVSALGSGATAVQFFLDRLGEDGVWYQVWASSSVTGPDVVSASVGPGMATAAMIGRNCRLRWDVSGAGGTVTATGGLIGR